MANPNANALVPNPDSNAGLAVDPGCCAGFVDYRANPVTVIRTKIVRLHLEGGDRIRFYLRKAANRTSWRATRQPRHPSTWTNMGTDHMD